MRIVQIIDTLERGGAEQACVFLCNGLATAGHSVTLIATRRGGPLEQSVDSSVRVEILGKRNLFDPAAHKHLRRLARDADVVHAHSTSIFSAVRALWRDAVPIVWHDHFGGPQRALPLRLIRRRIAASLTASESLAERARRNLGFEPRWFANAVPEPTDVVPASLPGIDRDRHRCVVCVANFRPEKNHLGLLEALAPLLRKRPDTRLILVGAGGDASTRPQIEARITRLDLERSVVLLGERDDVPAVLAASEIGVLASHFEAMPLTLLEYGWAALGVVAPSVGQIPQLLEGSGESPRGLCFEPGDATALHAAVERLLDDRELCTMLGGELQRHVARRHSVTAAVTALEELYRSLG